VSSLAQSDQDDERGAPVANAETIELGVPAVLYSRVITGPLAVLIAYAASIGLY